MLDNLLTALSMPIACYEAELQQMMADFNMLPLRDPQRVELSQRIVELRIELQEAKNERALVVKRHLEPVIEEARARVMTAVVELRMALLRFERVNQQLREYGVKPERLGELGPLILQLRRLVSVNPASGAARPNGQG